MDKSKKQWWGLLVIPVEMIINFYLFPLFNIEKEPIINLISTTILFVLGFLIMMYLFHDFLKTQWRLYRPKLFRKLLLSIVLMVGVFVIISLVRGLIPDHLLETTTTTSSAAVLRKPGWAVLAAITPFLAPFAEELTFRYLLLGKISNNFLRVPMLIIQGILFGLIHWHSFGGNVYATIPYMVVGIYLGVIYLFSKNIWSSLIVHWMLNTMNSLLPALFILILSFFGLTS